MDLPTSHPHGSTVHDELCGLTPALEVRDLGGGGGGQQGEDGEQLHDGSLRLIGG